jgi:hypothetical protein
MRRARRTTITALASLLTATATGASLVATSASGSAPTATLRLTLSAAVPVRSLTLSIEPPNGKQPCTMSQQAAAVTVSLSPKGDCQLPVGTLVIQDGRAPSQIEVSGSDAVPADAGRHWTLCGGTGSACTGKHGGPGANQLKITTVGGAKKPTDATILSYAAQCDTAFDLATGTAGCVASAGQTADEGIGAVVPSSSTDASTTFTTLMTWTVSA